MIPARACATSPPRPGRAGDDRDAQVRPVLDVRGPRQRLGQQPLPGPVGDEGHHAVLEVQGVEQRLLPQIRQPRREPASAVRAVPAAERDQREPRQRGQRRNLVHLPPRGGDDRADRGDLQALAPPQLRGGEHPEQAAIVAVLMAAAATLTAKGASLEDDRPGHLPSETMEPPPERQYHDLR